MIMSSSRQRDGGALSREQTVSPRHQRGPLPQNQLPGLPELRSEVPAPQSSVTGDRLHPHQGGAEGGGHQGSDGGNLTLQCRNFCSKAAQKLIKCSFSEIRGGCGCFPGQISS